MVSSTNFVKELEWPTYFAVKNILPPTVEEEKEVASKWGNEAKLLKEMNRRNKEHIVRFITAFKWGEDLHDTSYYLMFEWANGGSLENIWRKYPQAVSKVGVVKDAVKQMLGLAGALVATHQAKIRHGDLKPQNILCFLDNADSIFGTLKIGDWGLAKYHNVMTRSRQVVGQVTATKWGTALYEAPEADSMLGRRILSRQYDVWAMGCILLELIIWLLYGYEGIIRFRAEVQGTSREPVSFYRVIPGPNDTLPSAIIHEVVIKWMDHLELKEAACAEATALGRILTLVRKHLLVVKYRAISMATFNDNDEALTPLRKLSTSSQGPPPEASDVVRIMTPEEVMIPGDRSDGVTRIIGLGNQPGVPDVVLVSSDDDDKLLLPQEPSLIQSYRIESDALEMHLSHIYYNDEQGDDFWFPASPPGTPRRLPPKAAEKSYQDEKGYLTTPFLLQERLPPLQDANLVPGMQQLSVQAPVIVST
jgi:serine/threonine protein kinase